MNMKTILLFCFILSATSFVLSLLLFFEIDAIYKDELDNIDIHYIL